MQPLLVASLAEGGWGVLAGGRRFAALKLLAADKSTKGFTPKMPVACRVAASTVKEALRLGAIHPHIRQAHREGKLDVEALKAFDAHPDPNAQLAAFEALTAATSYGRLQSWKVRCHFQSRAMVRAGDALGALVLADYRAANGPITADLIEEDSILDDSAPIETVLRRLLSDCAEERRAAFGLAWSDVMLRPTGDELRAFGRVYRTPKTELSEEETAKSDAIAERLDALQAEYAAAVDEDDVEKLGVEHERLSSELDDLQHGYGQMESAVGGVIAVWGGGKIVFHDGLVRPSDMPERKGDSLGAPIAAGAQPSRLAAATWSESLRTDMAVVRTRSIALALAQNLALARDHVDFMLCKPIFASGYSSYDSGTSIRAEHAMPT